MNKSALYNFKMTYDDFYKVVCSTLGGKYHPTSYTKDGNLRYEGYYEWPYSYDSDPDNLNTRWRTGGVAGGSCWDDGTEDHHYQLGGEDEPEFPVDKLLEVVCPNMTFIQYRKILNEVVVEKDESIGEYYGNYTNYSTKTLSYKNLYEKLVSEGILKNEAD